eukprot:scaffold1534_cov267-Pinguiococcus_pyrenoidosus.AAC.24
MPRPMPRDAPVTTAMRRPPPAESTDTPQLLNSNTNRDTDFEQVNIIVSHVFRRNDELSRKISWRPSATPAYKRSRRFDLSIASCNRASESRDIL